jgi:RHS repeat-associated protein
MQMSKRESPRGISGEQWSILSVQVNVNEEISTTAQSITYDEFGNQLSNTNPDFQPFGYAGGLTDYHTDLIRFGARDYDPSVGRWTSKEPLGFAGALNFYVYCDNDGVNYVDPDGEFSWWIVGITLIGIGVLNVLNQVEDGQDFIQSYDVLYNSDEFNRQTEAELFIDKAGEFLPELASDVTTIGFDLVPTPVLGKTSALENLQDHICEVGQSFKRAGKVVKDFWDNAFQSKEDQNQ